MPPGQAGSHTESEHGRYFKLQGDKARQIQTCIYTLSAWARISKCEPFELIMRTMKASSHSRADIAHAHSFFLNLFFYLCTVFSCFFYTTGCEAYSFTTDEYGFFNVRTNVRACLTHKGGQTQTNLLKGWLEETEKLLFTLPRQVIEPRVFGFEFRLSNH